MSRRSSPVWSFFTVINTTKQIAKCDMCKADISFKSSVSNLKRHITSKHPAVKIGSAALKAETADYKNANIITLFCLY